jgi:Xaa-Pro dipeptidase
LNIARTTQLTRLAVSIAQANVSELFIDDTGLFLSEFKLLQGHITAAENPSGALAYRHIDRQVIWAQRVHKDEFEVKLMRKAAEIANIALTETLASLQEGQTEKDVAHFFERRLYELGADGPAFPTIVAFGDHATLPHHQPGKTKLTNETPVLIDCGAMVEAYKSDMTRTVWYGDQPTAEFLKIKQIVDHAYDIGMEQLRLRDLEQKTVTARDLDTAVRDYISEQGFGDNYIHTTGHGIGIDVHEPPSLYLTNSQPIEDGMIITIEPGIYLPLNLGYRYENTILVTSKAPEELTK